MKIDKIGRLEENLKVLNTIKASYTLEDLTSDKVDEWGLRYGLFESVQIIIDLSCHIVAEKNLGVPKSYAECIALLIANKYLEKDLGKRLTQMVGLRNLLIHDYGIIDIKRLYDHLEHLNDISDFVYAIKKVSK